MREYLERDGIMITTKHSSAKVYLAEIHYIFLLPITPYFPYGLAG